MDIKHVNYEEEGKVVKVEEGERELEEVEQ